MFSTMNYPPKSNGSKVICKKSAFQCPLLSICAIVQLLVWFIQHQNWFLILIKSLLYHFDVTNLQMIRLIYFLSKRESHGLILAYFEAGPSARMLSAKWHIRSLLFYLARVPPGGVTPFERFCPDKNLPDEETFYLSAEKPSAKSLSGDWPAASREKLKTGNAQKVKYWSTQIETENALEYPSRTRVEFWNESVVKLAPDRMLCCICCS